MKYIDTEKLYKYIEQVSEFYPRYADNFLDNAVINVINGIKTFISSLQQEQPDVDLVEEITKFFSENPIPHEHITDWPLLKNTALHFYELGLNARKEE